MKRFELMQFQNSHALAELAALAWIEEIEKSNRAGQTYCVALSGGRIAREFFSAIVEISRQRKTEFRDVHFFWTDERCVPRSDPESNYRPAWELLFEPLKIPERQIHRVLGEDSPTAAAAAVAGELSRFAALNQSGIPVLDMIFLGLGEDAHVASLFPGDFTAAPPSQRIYRVVIHSPKPPPVRVTLNYEVIAAARKVWMLASGAGKEKALRDSLSCAGQTPFARVLQSRSDTRIFTDIVAT